MATRAHPPDAVVALLRRYGRETTSFQTLEPGLSYWLDPDGDACVAYADTGAAWVAVGAPLAEPARRDEVAARFLEAARAAGRRARFFGVEDGDFGGAAFTCQHVGEQPCWDPRAWPEVLRKKRSLREQLRRARAKGVRVRRLAAAELSDRGNPIRRELDALVAEWQGAREMAPMGFVVQIALDLLPEERRVFVAEFSGQVVAFLGAVPVYARGGWFFEDVLRRGGAPNGTVELLIDHAMRALAEDGCDYVTYGLAPLARTPSPVLGWIRDHTRWLYHFDGLRAFKDKFQPAAWQPVYLAYPRRERGLRATVDLLAAFACGSFARFGWATLVHRAAAVTRWLAWLLLPWTALLIAADSARWFPSPAVKAAWIAYDLLLFTGLLSLARRWRPRLATALAGGAALDFSLGSVQAGLYNAERVRGPVDLLFLVLALGAPLFAALFLWSARHRGAGGKR
ncbi:DUF2156 domain-containing protein [Haliangium ochraceum]|uniref:Phosphatidylglycerol lysyltransferase C-terminal domain-containing protein n=1 Tax=Haliangium ochraceum (strain DSM 14365 / JCM 11303 / SMP-2) TaxID=502025 RepID=D0LKD8_HALO1|nr:DUF2156 domain-containing protein [Haliangium ochraceum]ACY13172.1 protein of unknown function DUF472 [Haliangium ochraceum DSM 14365]